MRHLEPLNLKHIHNYYPPPILTATGNESVPKITINNIIIFFLNCNQHFGLQCFDAVGRAAGRASGL